MKNLKFIEAIYRFINGIEVSEMFELIHDEFVYYISIEDGIFHEDHQDALRHFKNVARIIKPLNSVPEDNKNEIFLEVLKKLEGEFFDDHNLYEAVKMIHDIFIYNINIELYNSEDQTALHFINGVAEIIREMQNEMYPPKNDEIQDLKRQLQESQMLCAEKEKTNQTLQKHIDLLEHNKDSHLKKV